SSRSLLPRGTQLGLGLVEDLPKRGHDRLGTRTLPQLDGYTCCLGSEHARRDLLRLGTSPALSRRAGSLLQLVALEPALSGLSSQFGLFVRVGDPSELVGSIRPDLAGVHRSLDRLGQSQQ